MATVAFDSHRTIFHGLAGTEMAPLRVMPASHNGYELTTISKILDGHTWEMRLTSSSSAAPSEDASGNLWNYFIHESGRKQAGPPIGRTGRGELGVGCSVWLDALRGCS
jgi:hypothetical protein